MARQPVEQGQPVHEQSRARAGNRIVPRAEHLAAAPGLLEQGVTLGHAATIGARKIGIACAQLHAKVVEGGAAHTGASLNHVQMVGAKQHARQNPAHTGGRASLAVAAKRAFTVLRAQSHIKYAAVALEPQLDLARAHAIMDELGCGRMPKRGAARQQLQRLYEIGLSRRVGSRKYRHALVQGKTIALETAVVRDGKIAGEHGHGAALDANRHDQVQVVDLVVGLEDARLRVALELQRDLLLLGQGIEAAEDVVVVEGDGTRLALGLDIDRLLRKVLVIGDGGQAHLPVLDIDLELDGGVGARDNGHALEGGVKGGDVDLDARHARIGDELLVVGVHALDAARHVGGVAGLEDDLGVGSPDHDGRLAVHDVQCVVKGVSRNVELKGAFEGRGLDLRIAHGQTEGIGRHQAHGVVLDLHVHATQDGAGLVGRGDAPHAADHLGQDIGRQFHGALDGIGRKLGEVISIKRVQAERALLATNQHLALGQLKGDRGIGEGLGDIGEHLTGDNHLALFFDMRRDAMTDRDGVVRGLEFQDAVLGLDEHARQDGKGGCRSDTLHNDADGLCKRALADGELHLLIPFYRYKYLNNSNSTDETVDYSQRRRSDPERESTATCVQQGWFSTFKTCAKLFITADWVLDTLCPWFRQVFNRCLYFPTSAV